MKDDNDLDIDASDAIVNMARSFKKFVNMATIGHSVDGLLKVQRRIAQILSRFNGVKDVSEWASAVKPLHPHGESSIENAMTRLMQPFKYQIPLINTHGHSGGYKDAKASDKRYLKASPSEFFRDVYLDTHKAAMTYKFNESEDGSMEIEYLIPKIPMALCMGVEGIGFGYSTDCYPLDFNNVCALTTWYIDQVLAGKEASIIGNIFPREVCHLLLPHFPIEGVVRNAEQLMDGYTKGAIDGRVVIEGNFRLSQNEIIIHTIPYGTDFVTKSDQLEAIRKSKNKLFSNLIDAIDDVQNIVDGVMRMRYKIIFKKRQNSWDYLNDIVRIFNLVSSMTPQSRWLTKNGGHDVLGIGQLLDIWYRERTRAINIKFSKDQDEYILDLHRLKGILVLKDHDQEIIKIIRNSDTTDEYAKILKKKFDLSYFQAVEIGKVSLDKIKRTSRENIVNDIATVEAKLEELKQNMRDVPTFIKKEVMALQAKHGTHVPKRTIYPTYRGWLMTQQGCVQVQNLEEVKNRKSFDEVKLLYLPHIACRYKYMRNAFGKWDCDYPVLFPRHYHNVEVQYTSEPATHTVVIAVHPEAGRTLRACEGLYALPSTEYEQLIVAGSRITTIDQSDNVSVVPISQLPLRKGINSSGNKTNVASIFNQAYDQMVIFNWTEDEPNTLRASLIKDGKGKLNRYMGTSPSSFLIVPYVEDQLIFFPKGAFNRIKQSHIDIPNIAALFNGRNHVILDLTKLGGKKGKEALVRYYEL